MLWIWTPSTSSTLILGTSTGLFYLLPACMTAWTSTAMFMLSICMASRECPNAHMDAVCRIERLEIFDEFEEWHMIQVHS